MSKWWNMWTCCQQKHTLCPLSVQLSGWILRAILRKMLIYFFCIYVIFIKNIFFQMNICHEEKDLWNGIFNDKYLYHIRNLFFFLLQTEIRLIIFKTQRYVMIVNVVQWNITFTNLFGNGKVKGDVLPSSDDTWIDACIFKSFSSVNHIIKHTLLGCFRS